MGVFRQLDLQNGYHSIVVSKEAQPVTGFVINNQHFEYLRLPFGLSNAPRVFQKTMIAILAHISYARIFLDDILVYLQNENEHVKHLNQVLSLLKTSNIILNFNKSKFFQSKVKYLGHEITRKALDQTPRESIHSN